jgi:hypothetical protein
MYFCYFLLTDSDGNPKPIQVKVKLPVIPRVGDYINIDVSQIGEEGNLLAGKVKAVSMHCAVEKELRGFGLDAFLEAQVVLWHIFIEETNESPFFAP